MLEFKEYSNQLKKLELARHLKLRMMYHISRGENETEASLSQKLVEIMTQGLELSGIEIVKTNRCFGNPSPIKVEFYSVNEKIDVLRANKKLPQKRQSSNIYIRSAKSHDERLIELNFKQLIDNLEISDVFRFTGSGRLVYKDEKERNNRSEGGKGRGNAHEGRKGRGRGGQQHWVPQEDKVETKELGEAQAQAI